MAKLTLTDISSGYQSTSTQNANNQLIEDAIENTLSRDGTSPNTMSAALDMNSNKINNLTDGTNNQDAVTVAQLNGAALGTYTITYETVSSEVGAGNATDGSVLTADGSGNTTWEVATSLTPWTENIDAAAYSLSNAEIKDYSITPTTVSSSSGTLTLDIENGNSFQTTLTENVTTLTISNPSATSKHCEIVLKAIQDSTGSWTITWPAAVKWPTGTAPTMTTTATTGTDIYYLVTWDAGTTWYANASQDYS